MSQLVFCHSTQRACVSRDAQIEFEIGFEFGVNFRQKTQLACKQAVLL